MARDMKNQGEKPSARTTQNLVTDSSERRLNFVMNIYSLLTILYRFTRYGKLF